MPDDELCVEVAYATPTAQHLIALTLPAGSDAQTAVRASGLVERIPELAATPLRLGVFSTPCPPDQVLRPGDRVEIYRPLLHDPKQARRRRAARKR